MQHKFVCYKRFKDNSMSGPVNISYGTKLYSDNKVILYQNKPVCTINSTSSFNHFAIDDDNQGLERSNYTSSIIDMLSIRNEKYQDRWNKLWDDELSNTMRREDYPDYWLWSEKFYQASIPDLIHILQLIKEVS